jgi:hypothetical protein
MEHSCGKRSKKGYPQGPKRLALLPEGEASSPFEGLQREGGQPRARTRARTLGE